MKIIKTIDLDNWKDFCTCDNCYSKLEINESDLRCEYRDRYTAWLIIKNDKVILYCICLECNHHVRLYGVPGAIVERIKSKYPPPKPPEKKLNWFEKLFNSL